MHKLHRLSVVYHVAAAAVVTVFLGCSPKHVFGDFEVAFEVASELTEQTEPSNYAVDFAYTPDDSGKYVVGYRNGVLEMRAANHSLLHTITVDVRRGNECGLLALSLAPDFAVSGRIYVGYCEPGAGSALASFVWSEANSTAAPTSLIEIPAAPNDFHNLGAIGFDDAGDLFVTFGDGNVRGTPQDMQDFRGKLLRIRPTPQGPAAYSIPENNPFVNDAAIAPEIVGFGLKSPFRVAADSGFWFIGDVGVEAYEEINLLSVAGPHNFGYPLCEGLFHLTSDYVATDDPCNLGDDDDYRAPLIHYEQENYTQPHFADDPEASKGTLWAVVAGLVYRGKGYDGVLDGRFLYADYGRGFVRSALFDPSANGGSGGLTDDRHLGHLGRSTAWRIAPDGFIYVLAKNQLHRLTLTEKQE